jgi:hypothetical protein
MVELYLLLNLAKVGEAHSVHIIAHAVALVDSSILLGAERFQLAEYLVDSHCEELSAGQSRIN